MNVKQFINQNGNPQPNHFIIKHDGIEYFQSYNTIIIKRDSGRVYLDVNYWDFSPTTSKHRNFYLGLSTDEIKENIKLGRFKLEDLNK